MLGASLLQSSAIGVLLFFITFKCYFVDYKLLWKETWKAWGLIAGAIFLSVLCSELALKSVKGAYDIFRGGLLFFVAASIALNFEDDVVLSVSKKTFLACTVAMLISYAVLVFLHDSWWLRDNPILAINLAGIHEYANVVSIILLGLISLWCVERNNFPVLYMACVLALITILLMTNSRGAYLALAVCSLPVLLRFVPSLKVLCLFFVAGILLAFYYISFVHTGSDLLGHEIPFSFLERRRLSMGTLEAVLREPWFGYGFNTYKYIARTLSDGEMFVMPHNIYMGLLFSIGFMGSMSGLAGLVYFYWRLQPSKAIMLSKVEEFYLLFAQLILLYLAFRGLTELKLGFKVWGSIAIAYGLMAAVNMRIKARNKAIYNNGE